MSIGVLFWVLMILWLVFRVWSSNFYGPTPASTVRPTYWTWAPGTLLLWILLFLLGWHAFGFPIHS